MNNYFKSCFDNVLVIAEIGVNHNGDLGMAFDLVNAAVNTGADAVKFQTFSADKLVVASTKKVPYQQSCIDPSETHYGMLKKLELSIDDHLRLKAYCDDLGILFLSTPYDIDSAKFLNEEIDVPFFKTASADIVDIPLHSYIASTGKPCIVSVGMASLSEIETIYKTYSTLSNHNLLFLHCVSNYPCSDSSLNLNVLSTLAQAFQVPVGLSDHSVGKEAAILSIGLGGMALERHFTLDKTLHGPDHKASSTPDELSSYIQSVRRCERMLGSPIKVLQSEEKDMSIISRKSLHLNSNLAKDSLLTEACLVLKRPGTGLDWHHVPYLIGRRIKIDLPADHQINYTDVV